VLAVVLTLLPGGFVILFGYVLFRALHGAWVRSRTAHAGHAQVREVVSAISLRELVDSAKHAI
jgi:hypothetical protein